jgi:hypothetical protein
MVSCLANVHSTPFPLCCVGGINICSRTGWLTPKSHGVECMLGSTHSSKGSSYTSHFWPKRGHVTSSHQWNVSRSVASLS